MGEDRSKAFGMCFEVVTYRNCRLLCPSSFASFHNMFLLQSSFLDSLFSTIHCSHPQGDKIRNETVCPIDSEIFAVFDQTPSTAMQQRVMKLSQTTCTRG